MLSMLVFWNDAGEVVGTLSTLMVRNENGEVVGHVDFEAVEDSGGRIRELCDISTAAGGGAWPEWLEGKAHDFTVELDPNPSPARARIAALVHKKSGHRRERADIEAAIAERIQKANGKPADIRDVVGGPNRPLLLDEDGRTKARTKAKRPVLPVVKRGLDT